MRPAHKRVALAFRIVREQADLKLPEAAQKFFEHPNPVLRLLPFAEANPIRSFF